MVVLAIYTLSILHPGLLLSGIAEADTSQMETKRGDSEEGSRSMLLRPYTAPYRD